MESQPQNPEFMNNPENFPPCVQVNAKSCYYQHRSAPTATARELEQTNTIIKHTFTLPPPGE